MPQLIDFSQITIAAVTAFQKDLRGSEPKKVVDLIRHVTLSSILGHKKRFRKYGIPIITTDSTKGYWRKDVFQYYKANRKKARDASDLDWGLIFDTINQLRHDLAEYFPYPVLNVDKAEADDIIGIMTKYFQENELVQEGLFAEPQPILIISADHDHVQLQKWKNVEQYSPMQKKYVKSKNSVHSLIEKIVTGDSGDGIPNICSVDHVFVTEGIRQKSFMQKRFPDFYEKGIDACNNDEERRNFQRNETLISYEKIPTVIENKILETYKSLKVERSLGKIREYLIKHRCRNLLDAISEF